MPRNSLNHHAAKRTRISPELKVTRRIHPFLCPTLFHSEHTHDLSRLLGGVHKSLCDSDGKHLYKALILALGRAGDEMVRRSVEDVRDLMEKSALIVSCLRKNLQGFEERINEHQVAYETLINLFIRLNSSLHVRTPAEISLISMQLGTVFSIYLDILSFWLSRDDIREVLWNGKDCVEELFLILIRLVSQSKRQELRSSLCSFFSEQLLAKSSKSWHHSTFSIAYMVTQSLSHPKKPFDFCCEASKDNMPFFSMCMLCTQSEPLILQRSFDVLLEVMQNKTNSQNLQARIFECMTTSLGSPTKLDTRTSPIMTLHMILETPIGCSRLLISAIDFFMLVSKGKPKISLGDKTNLIQRCITIAKNNSTPDLIEAATSLALQQTLSLRTNLDPTEGVAMFKSDWQSNESAQRNCNQNKQEVDDLLLRIFPLCLKSSSNPMEFVGNQKALIAEFVSVVTRSRQNGVLLSRYKTVLDEMVRLAARGNVTATNVLLSLSDNPVNRRCLALHPGLLAALISFLRSNTDPGASEDCLALDRLHIKNKISILAKSL